MIRAIDLRRGRAVLYDDTIYTVKEATHVAKGNKQSFMQVKLKNVQTGQIIDVRFRVDETVEVPFLETREYEYLYEEGEQLVCMDTSTYEQINIPKELVGEAVVFLKPNERLTVQMHEGSVVTADLPNTVELEVVDAPPVVKGATVTNQPKVVTVETGAKVKVPPFIATGDRIRVDTRSGEYLERAK